MRNQCVTVNIHGPKVVRIGRLENSVIAMDLENEGQMNGSVTIFASDDELRLLADAINEFFTQEWTSEVSQNLTENFVARQYAEGE